MGSTYDKNLNSLRKLNPSAAYLVETSGASLPPPPFLQSVGQVNLEDSKAKLIVIAGIGNGSLLEVITQNKNLQEILCYEPQPERIKYWLEQNDQSKILIDERVRFITGINPELTSELIEHYLREEAFRLVHAFNYLYFAYPGYEKIAEFSKANDYFHSALQQGFQRVIATVTPNEEDAFWGLGCVVDNFPDYYLNPNILSLQNIFSKKPGVMVATGPSLDQALPFLQNIQDKVIIAACDSAVDILIKNSIVPDFVCSVERGGNVSRNFETLPELKNTYLVMPGMAHSWIHKKYKGPKLTFWATRSQDSWLIDTDDTFDIGTSPSCAHLAYITLKILGCDPLFLIGHDLAYDPKGNRPHASEAGRHVTSGYLEGDKTVSDTQKPVLTEGHNGKQIKSTPIWQHFAALYSSLIPQYGGTTYNVIPENSGIPIPFTTRLDYEDAKKIIPNQVISKNEIQKNLKNPNTKSILQTAEMKKGHIINILKKYEELALTAMYDIGMTWRNFPPHVSRDGLEETWNNLFSKSKEKIEEIKNVDRSFFDCEFKRLILNSYLGSEIEEAQCRSQTKDFADQTVALIDIYYRRFHLFHLWSARSRDLMNRVRKA